MATKAEREKRIEELADEYGISDEHLEEFKTAYAGEGLRAENKKLSDQLKEFKDKAEKWDDHQAQGGIEKALRDKNVDWDSLSDLERRTVVREVKEIAGDEAKLESYIQDNNLPVSESQEGAGSEEGSEASNVSQFRREAKTKASTSTTKIDASEMAKWSAEKIARFEEKYPEEHEAVLQGKEVNVAF